MCHIFTYTAYTLDYIIALTAGGGLQFCCLDGYPDCQYFSVFDPRFCQQAAPTGSANRLPQRLNGPLNGLRTLVRNSDSVSLFSGDGNLTGELASGGGGGFSVGGPDGGHVSLEALTASLHHLQLDGGKTLASQKASS